MVSKMDPKSDPKSPKWVPKAIPKWGSKETSTNDDFQHPWMWLKCSKYKQDQWFSAFGVDPLVGLIWEVFWEPKWRPRPSKSRFKKTSKQWCPTWAQTGPKGGPKMEPKSSKMRSWKHLVSRVAPKRPPDPLQDRFWRGFGTILGPCSSVFLTYVEWFLQAFFSSMLQTKTFKSQGITKRMQQRASKKQLLSSCHLALKVH